MAVTSNVATTIEESIASAWEAANSSLENAQKYSDQAVNASQGVILTGGIHQLTEPDKPELIMPSHDLAGIYANEYDAAMDELKALLDDRLDKFLDTYYPDYSEKLATVSDWLDNAIKNGGTGLPTDIETAIWDRERSRHDSQALRSEEEVMSTWAARGFPLPPGVATRKVRQVQQENADNLQHRSREIAIQQATMEVENIRFAVQQSAALQVSIVSAATQYMNAVINVASQAAVKAASLVDAIRALYALTESYNRIALDAERLTLQYDQAAANRDLTANQLDVNAFQAQVQARVEAAMAGARSMGEMAAAAISSQNTLSSLGHETTAYE